MVDDHKIAATINGISGAANWNRRVSLIRQIPEDFGKASHQTIYAAIAEAAYVADLAPDFAYIHWRDGYELPEIERAYVKAHAITRGFKDVSADALERAIASAPETLRILSRSPDC